MGRCRIILGALAIAAAFGTPSRAADDTRSRGEMSRGEDASVTTMKKGGTTFEQLGDWPTRKTSSVVTAVSLEEYLSLKFSEFNVQLQAMDQHLNRIEERLQTVEQNSKTFQGRIEQLEAGASSRLAIIGEDSYGHPTQKREAPVGPQDAAPPGSKAQEHERL